MCKCKSFHLSVKIFPCYLQDEPLFKGKAARAYTDGSSLNNTIYYL